MTTHDAARLRLFVFGTLRDADIRTLVLGTSSPIADPETAWLTDHGAVTLPDESYPVLAPEPGSRLPGLLLDLDEAQLARVAFYEGEEYVFDRVTVSTAAGDTLALVCAERITTQGPRHAWSFDAWLEADKALFLPRASRFMALFGAVPIDEAERLWRGGSLD